MSDTTPHYLLITVGTAGDVHPFMHMARALQALGRKVTLITHSYHAKLVQGAGLPFIGLGNDEDYLRLLANPALWDPKKSFSAFMANYREQIEQIDEAIRSIPTEATWVAIAHPLAVPAAALLRERGFITAVVAAYLAPSNLRTCYDPLTIGPTSVPRWVPMSWRRALWRFVEKSWIDPVAVAQINAAREPHGLPKVHSLLTHIAEVPDLSVTLFPSWFAPPSPDWPRPLVAGDFPLFEPARHDGFAADLSAFLAAGEKPLVFTAGTANFHADDFFAHALSAVNNLGRRAIFLTRERAQVPAHLPASVLWQPYVPLSALLPHAAVLAHHGGIGTTAEALRAGTPQLITPFAWDQFDNGARIALLGVGMVTPAKHLQPRKLARSLQTLATSDAIRARCLQLAAHFVPPHDPTALCREVERIVLARHGDAQHSSPPDPSQLRSPLFGNSWR
jgi:rhamnosyltransferase subunit B